jgi:F-type H+-transporting ATPase subunit b
MKKVRQAIRRWFAAGRPAWGGIALAGVCVMLVAGDAFAAGGGHHGDPHVNWWTWDEHAPPVGWFIVDFLIFAFALKKLAGPKLVATFQQRHETIKAAIEEADSSHKKVTAEYERYRDKLANIDTEVKDLVGGAKSDGKDEKERIIEGAKSYSERMRKDSETIVEHEEEYAKLRLRNETARAALSEAQQILSKAMSDADLNRLFEQSIEELQNGKAMATKRDDGAGSSVSAGGAP